MDRNVDWTIEEFEILIRNNSLSSLVLSNQLPLRTHDAVQYVRNGIHQYHIKGETTFLSKLIKDKLVQSRGSLECPICGVKI